MNKTLLNSAMRNTPGFFPRNAQPEDPAGLSEPAIARIRREILRKFLARVRGAAAPGFSWHAHAGEHP